jgi:hypothetical protein
LGWREVAAYTTGLGGSEAIAFAIADNRTAELSEWDTEDLGQQVRALLEDGVKIGAVGFTEVELEELGAWVPSFDPVSIDDQGKLDEKAAVECPECGHSFNL